METKEEFDRRLDAIVKREMDKVFTWKFYLAAMFVGAIAAGAFAMVVYQSAR